jgi:hypothetical protein
LEILLLGKELTLFEWSLTRIDHEIVLVIDDALKITRSDVEEKTETTRHALQEPDVRDWNGEFDMPHAVATNARHGHFDTTTVADHTLIFDTLVFTTSALVVTHRTEDALAEKTTWLRFECAVINRLGVLHLTAGPFTNGLGGSDRDADLIEGLGGFIAKNVACYFSAH